MKKKFEEIKERRSLGALEEEMKRIKQGELLKLDKTWEKERIEEKKLEGNFLTFGTP